MNLSRAVTVADLRLIAKRRLPRAVFDFIDGAAEDERWHLRPDGRRFWGSGTLMTLKDSSGTVTGFVKCMRDRTPQRQTEAALVEALRSGRIRAGLDVYDREPPPADHPLRQQDAAVLTPHLGYSTRAVFAQLYGESVENILAYLDGSPIRVVNPAALRAAP